MHYADALKAVRAAYAKDDRLTIITLHADPTIDQAGELAGSKNADWPQGYIGPNSKVQADYHANTALILLIGPDGKIVARHLTKETLPHAVTAALVDLNNQRRSDIGLNIFPIDLSILGRTQESIPSRGSKS